MPASPPRKPTLQAGLAAQLAAPIAAPGTPAPAHITIHVAAGATLNLVVTPAPAEGVLKDS